MAKRYRPYLAFVANMATAGVLPSQIIQKAIKLRVENKHTVRLLQDVWDKVRFMCMVHSCDGKLELVAEL